MFYTRETSLTPERVKFFSKEKKMEHAQHQEGTCFAGRFFDLLSADRCPECGSPVNWAFNDEEPESGEFVISCKECVFAICGTGSVYWGE